jgi:DNA repair protein RecN (Recombination protein N)
MADTHFHIDKGVSGERTVTTVSKLDREERKMEIARIIGGQILRRQLKGVPWS